MKTLLILITFFTFTALFSAEPPSDHDEFGRLLMKFMDGTQDHETLTGLVTTGRKLLAQETYTGWKEESLQTVAHDPRVVKLLLEQGANVRCTDSLLHAVLNGLIIENDYPSAYQALSLLVKAGASMNGINTAGNTFLMAILYLHPVCVEHLIFIRNSLQLFLAQNKKLISPTVRKYITNAPRKNTYFALLSKDVRTYAMSKIIGQEPLDLAIKNVEQNTSLDILAKMKSLPRRSEFQAIYEEINTLLEAAHAVQQQDKDHINY